MATDHSDDLDQLLDSALDDFQSLNLTSGSQRSGDGEEKKDSSFMPGEVQGLGMMLPDRNAKKKGKQKASGESKDSHVAEALDKLREQTREAVKGLESVAGPRPGVENMGNDAMMEEWVKQFEELSGSQGQDISLLAVNGFHSFGLAFEFFGRVSLGRDQLLCHALYSILSWLLHFVISFSIYFELLFLEPKDMESIVETMMQQLLSKEILHEPMKEIEDRYPKWLEDNKVKLSTEEYERYKKQYEFIRDLNKVYETEPSNFNKIVELMQKMQECGQPPNDIVHELAPDFDISSLGQLSPEMLEGQQNCSIM
ncbi:hypothetical protein MTR67_036996 [Solanum verrucosum]|uniref:Uncharacterized protein n=1 Tax=Solanum verrucosum TaxID=315347 RepID=A0AAF0UDF6_SOLVR|nr:hypothetical protein MTR67_036996 [Solanum verrucosum]